jgi:uncharacterized protein
MSLTASRYNLRFDTLEEGLQVVYNTLTEGAVLVTDKVLALIGSNPDELVETRQQELERAGVLVDPGVDERRVFRVNHNRLKYGTREAYFMLYTTYACNMACTYCYESFLTRTKGEKGRMTPEVTESTLRFIKSFPERLGTRSLRLFFFGGEPLLNTAPMFTLLKELRPWSKAVGVDLTCAVCTNGAVPLSPLLPKLVEAEMFFHFTLDGPQEVHDARRPYAGGRGTYQDILRNIDLVQKAGADFGIRINLDRTNAPHVEALLEELRGRFGPGLNVRFAEVIPPVERPGEANTCSWARQCLVGSEPNTIVRLMSAARRLGMTVVARPLRDWVFCEFLREHSYIVDPYGDLYKCEGLAGLKEHRAGQLSANGRARLDHTFSSWLSYDPLESECGDCVYLPACGGGCPCLTFEEKGTYHAGGCTMFKPLLHKFIEYYLASSFPGLMAGEEAFGLRTAGAVEGT